MFWDTEQTKSFAVSWLKSILLYNYGAGNKRRWEMSYSRVSLFSLLAKSRILSFTRNIWRKMSFQVKFQFKIRQKCRSKWNDIGHTLELGTLGLNLVFYAYLILSYRRILCRPITRKPISRPCTFPPACMQKQTNSAPSVLPTLKFCLVFEKKNSFFSNDVFYCWKKTVFFSRFGFFHFFFKIFLNAFNLLLKVVWV